MRRISVIRGLTILMLITGSSCSKDSSDQDSSVTRTIQFKLYSQEDFSDDDDSIRFRLSIETSANKKLWDSLLPAMSVKDIPDQAHQIFAEKSLLTQENGILRAGFFYSIDGVGNSWYLDSIPAGVNFKVVEFSFK